MSSPWSPYDLYIVCHRSKHQTSNNFAPTWNSTLDDIILLAVESSLIAWIRFTLHFETAKFTFEKLFHLNLAYSHIPQWRCWQTTQESSVGSMANNFVYFEQLMGNRIFCLGFVCNSMVPSCTRSQIHYSNKHRRDQCGPEQWQIRYNTLKVVYFSQLWAEKEGKTNTHLIVRRTIPNRKDTISWTLQSHTWNGGLRSRDLESQSWQII